MLLCCIADSAVLPEVVMGRRPWSRPENIFFFIFLKFELARKTVCPVGNSLPARNQKCRFMLGQSYIIKHYQLLHNKSGLTLTSLNKTHHLARIIIYCCISDGITLEGPGRVAIVLSIVDNEIYSTRRHPQPRGG